MQKVFFAPLRKVDDADDGSIMVTGIASTETRDSSGEIILAAAIKKALPEYKRYPAIREMHRSTSAAGRAVEIDVDDDGVTHLTAHIVDPDAVKKVKTKTYGGFSVGGKVLARDKKDPTIITEILLAEISLVDRPAHPDASISMWKIDAGVGDDDLAKVIGSGTISAESRLADLADRVEKAMGGVAKMAADNKTLSEANANLTKQLADLRKPYVVIDNSRAHKVLGRRRNRCGRPRDQDAGLGGALRSRGSIAMMHAVATTDHKDRIARAHAQLDHLESLVPVLLH